MRNDSWEPTPLSALLTPVSRGEPVLPTREYRLLGARWYAKGLYIKDVKPGSSIRADRLYRVEHGDFVYNRLFAWKGSFAVASQAEDGCYVSNEFPCFVVDDKKLSGKFLWYYLSNEATWNEALELSSGGTPISRNRLKEDHFLSMRLRLPDRAEQDRIVFKIDTLASKLEKARTVKNEIEREAEALLNSAFSRIVEGARKVRIGDVAPLVRRPVETTVDGEYPELGVRSFGRGVFHKPTLVGAELTWQKLFRVHEGDIVISNIKAWEGAIAVAGPDDDGRVGSHRYLTLVPIEGKATAGFLCFYLLTDAGLADIGHASPGSADRNRTLGQKTLEEIEVPLPDYDQQVWFNHLQAKVREMLVVQQGAETERNAMLPSILDKAFKGEL